MIMDGYPMKLKAIFIVIFFSLTVPLAALAKVGDWTTYTSQTDIRDLLLVGNTIWCATNGGVFRYDIAANSYLQFNNTNGLTSIDAQALAIDQQGQIWVGFANGSINYYQPERQQWNSIKDYVGRRIYDLALIGDSVLVALDIGLSLYDVRRHEVKETYKRLGWAFPSGTSVTRVTIVNREIWAATSLGIARSSFDRANLMAPESWQNYTMSQGLPTNQINAIVSHNDSIYAATNNGVAVFRQQRWESRSTNLSYAEVRGLLSKNGTLYALTYGYVSRWIPEEMLWRNVAEYVTELSCFAVADNGDLWVGRNKSGSGRGFAHFSMAQQRWEFFVPPGPASNEFNGLAVDQNGVLWCASARDGILKFDGTTWRQFTTKDGLINDGIKCVTVDAQNRKWFGSEGGGLIRLDADEQITVFYRDYLAPAGVFSDFVVVPDVKVDEYGNVWILNTEANNGRVVAVYAANGTWYYFSVAEGILSNAVTALAIDWVNRIWVGTQAGVSVIDYQNTLALKSDDIIKDNNLTTNDGLESNQIRDIAIDQDNIIWIATSAGVNYWYWDSGKKTGVVNYQPGLLSTNVNTIEVDIRNNKWFGTSAGVSILAPDGYSFTHYTTANSSLVYDNVTSIAFDVENGKAYIGTGRGLSVLETPYSRPRLDLSRVKAGPNPFIIHQAKQFNFMELADDVAIKFLNESGQVVRHISNDEIFGNYFNWDGRDDQQQLVPSGIYIYVIYNEETGMHLVGKVAVIR